MKKLIYLIFILFTIINFSGCYKKIDNTSFNKNYKILDEIAVISFQTDVELIYQVSLKTHQTIPKNEYLEICKLNSSIYFNEILITDKFINLLEIKNIKVTDIKNAKKLLVIKPIRFESLANTNGLCSLSSGFTDISIYDINEKPNKFLIYENRFFSDENYNTIPLGGGYSKLKENSTNEKDVNKFFKAVIDDLESIMHFSNKK